MTEIMPPHRQDAYAGRASDCQFAIEPAFQTLIHQSQSAGWSKDDVAEALFTLAGTHIKCIIADRQTDPGLQPAKDRIL